MIDPKKLRAAAIMGNAVLAKAIMILIGFWGGHQLDLKWGTSPWMMFLCGLVAIGLGLWYLLVMLKKIQG